MGGEELHIGSGAQRMVYEGSSGNKMEVLWDVGLHGKLHRGNGVELL
jgi:hypothetical protein